MKSTWLAIFVCCEMLFADDAWDHQVTSEHFHISYMKADRSVCQELLAAGEAAYVRLAHDFCIRAPIIIHIHLYPDLSSYHEEAHIPKGMALKQVPSKGSLIAHFRVRVEGQYLIAARMSIVEHLSPPFFRSSCEQMLSQEAGH